MGTRGLTGSADAAAERALATPRQRRPPALSFNRARTSDLLLQEQNAVEQSLSCGWTAWNVDIDWNYAIASANYGVRVVVVAAAVRTRAHRDYVTGLGHLIVDLTKGWCHLVAECSRYDHHVRLARRRSRRGPEALQVISRHRNLHLLDGAACKAERHPHQGTRSCPGDDIAQPSDEKSSITEGILRFAERMNVAE